jgi:hypothetical protein
MLQRQLSHLTVVSLTTAKIKTLLFSIRGFALSYTAKMFILIILYDFSLSPAHIYYIIVYTRKVESRVQIVDQCTPRKISSGAENLVL